MNDCIQETITDAAFVQLRGIHTLSMYGCNQATITGAAIAHLVGIVTLETTECRRDVRFAAAIILGDDYESQVENESFDGWKEGDNDDD